MIKAVLISIQPKWCELILRGKKIIEVRKSKPILKTPFKVYIYCTNNRSSLWILRENLRMFCGGKIATLCNAKDVGGAIKANGKVIGEFVCNMITPIAYTMDGLADVVDCKTACMKPSEFIAYGKGKPLYGWHISNLVIYDKPKELSELRAICRHYDDGLCGDCEYYDYANNESYRYEECGVDGLKPITRPPQSWCYVEEREENA